MPVTQQSSKSKCLTPECRKEGLIAYKSLCLSCYSTAKKMVEAGKTTWEQLAAMGLVQVKLDPFTKAFNTKCQEGGE